MNLQQMLEKRAQLIASMRSELDKGDAADLAAYDTLEAECKGLDEKIQRAEQLATREAALNQPATRAQKPGGKAPTQMHYGGDDRATADKRAVRLYAHGDEGAIREMDAQMRAEARASNATDQNITTPADGGYLVPTGHYQGIIARANEIMLYPKLGVMEVPGLGTTVNVPTGGAVNPFVATNESGAQDLDGAAFGQGAMTLAKFTKKMVLTDELLGDEGSGLLNYLNGYVGDAYALTHNSTLVTEVMANGTSVTLGTAAAANVNDIPLLVGSVKDSYAEMGMWLMKRANQFKYAALQGSVFQLAATPGGGPQEFWGYPIANSEYVAAIAAGAKSVAFGAFRYVGVRTTGMTFLRDPYSNADNGQVVLRYYTRIVYKVLQAEAIVYGKHPTA